MVTLNGSASYRQSIDANITGKPTKDDTAHTTTYNGIATISLKNGPLKTTNVKDVRISITLIGSYASKLWIGNQPVNRTATTGSNAAKPRVNPVNGTATTGPPLLSTTIYGVQIPPYQFSNDVIRQSSHDPTVSYHGRTELKAIIAGH